MHSCDLFFSIFFCQSGEITSHYSVIMFLHSHKHLCYLAIINSLTLGETR